MDIIHTQEKHRFDLYDEEKHHLGELEYKPGGNKDLYATHTEVFPEYEGRGYARQLLDAFVAYAEEGGYKIVPICPYVIGAFRKYPEKYKSVIK